MESLLVIVTFLGVLVVGLLLRLALAPLALVLLAAPVVLILLGSSAWRLAAPGRSAPGGAVLPAR